MASKQERRERYLSRLARKRQEKVAELFFTALLAIVPSSSLVPVFWKCALWLVSWLMLLHLLFTWFGPAAQMRNRFKLASILGLTIFMVTVTWHPIYRMWKQEKAAALSGEISAPRPWFNKSPKPQSLMEIGDSGSILAYTGPTNKDAIGILYNAGLRIEPTENGLEVSTPVRDRQGHIVAEIKSNHWSVSPAQSVCWDKNYNNNSLEVLDGRGHVVFQIIILPDRVQLQGEWHDEFGRGVRFIKSPDPNSPGGLMVMWDNVTTEQQHAGYLIKPIFKYPSSEHWGEMLEDKKP